jgi:flagellar biosynthesis/type III secretory pathway protein FliH
MTTTAETTDMQPLLAFARDHNACREARSWLTTQTDPHVAWETCERPDWMIWFARRRSVERKVLVRIACDCARTALRFVPEGEDRPRRAIEAAEAWAEGRAAVQEVRDAAYADAYADAYAAAYADAYAAAAYADAAADAAYAAADAAYAAAADTVRRHIPLAVAACACVGAMDPLPDPSK